MTHDYVRPYWTCGRCDGEWPCAPAKVELAERFQNAVALRQYMTGLMEAAAMQLPLPIQYTELRSRFVEWVPQGGRP